ncbi:MAG: hypothetical protein ABW047_11905 [Nitrospiraceae bacterium]
MIRPVGAALRVMLFVLLSGCATSHYTPLASTDQDQVEQIKEHIYRVEYRMSVFTSQEQLDEYLRRRCAELTVREGYDLFHLTQRADVLGLSRRTSVTVTMYKGAMPVGATDLIDARALLGTIPASRSGEN